MEYTLKIQRSTRSLDLDSTVRCYTLEDATLTYHWYCELPNVTALHLYKDGDLIMFWEKGGTSNE